MCRPGRARTGRARRRMHRLLRCRVGFVAEGFTIGRLGEFETNGRWQLVRRGLGVESFGLNVVEIEQGYSIPEHDETERDQEEVFVVLEGDAVMVIEGEDHPAPAGTFVRVAPQLTRTVRNDRAQPVTLL